MPKLVREQNQREQQLKEAIIELPPAARSMALAAIILHNDRSIGGNALNPDGTVVSYSYEYHNSLVRQIYASGTCIPDDFYDTEADFCPENISFMAKD